MRTFVHNFIWLLLLAVAFEQATCKVYVRRRFDPEEQAQARFTAGFINKFSTTTTTTTTTTAPVTTTVSSPATTSTPVTTSTVPAPAAASPTATATARDTLPTFSDLDSGFFNDDDGFGKANDLSGDFSEEPEDSVSSADYESDAPANYVRMQKHRPAPAAAEQEAEEDTDDNSERMHNNDDAEDDDEEDAAADDDEEGQENAVGRAARAQPSEWNRRQMNRRMTNRQIQRLENEYKRRIKTLRERQKEVLRRNALRNRRAAAVRRRRLQNRQREIEKRTRLQRQRRRRRLQNQRRRRQQKQKARRRQIQNQNRLNRFRRGGGNRRIVRVVL